MLQSKCKSRHVQNQRKVLGMRFDDIIKMGHYKTLLETLPYTVVDTNNQPVKKEVETV